MKPCSMCGRPTTSKYAMCNREGSACRVEYQRLWALDQDKEHRNEIARRYRHRQKGAPAVYGILFPAPAILKVGHTTSSSSALYVGIARHGARTRGWEVGGSSCIWKKAGDVRTEAWMQATLAFQWPAAFGKRQNRICEWFDVSALAPEEVVSALTEVYGRVPADLVTYPSHLRQ